ncbi:MAG: type IV secretion protein DotG [Alphaproteobacteria bacterium]|nr:type IV secretion protein DotG [Alphaproteobacteria bacterium]
MSDDVIKAGSGDNDLDNADFDDVSGLDDDFGGPASGQTLGDLVKNSPLVKLGIIVGVITLIIGVIILFGGSKDQGRNSRVAGSGSGLVEAPGAEEVTESYQDAVTDFNINEVERALKQGDSALPVPVGTTRGRVGLEDEQLQAEDPLERWRRIQEERQKRQQGQRPTLPTVDPNAEQIDALTKLMQAQMESILSSKVIEPLEEYAVTSDEWIDEKFAREEKARLERAKALADAAAAAEDAEASTAEIILPAGTIEYAQLLIEANSDAVGPVLAQIVSGPLSGSRILGSFKVEEEYLVLSFNQVVIDGVVHKTDAVALDPETTGIGIVTDIDRRYFKRVILPAAAAFVEGMAGAIADTGNTVVVVGDTAIEQEDELDTNEQLYKGLEEAAGEVSDLLDEEADATKVQVKVRAGTPIGILFVAPVLENSSNPTVAEAPPSALNNPLAPPPLASGR